MQMTELLKTPAGDRDEHWEDRFLSSLTESSLRLLSEEPQIGPDGWPYLMVETVEGGEPAQKVLQWLGTRGIGLAVNPQKDYPDFILSWGMIWNFRETGRFLRRDLPVSDGKVELTKEMIAHAGTPSPQFLPDYVRQILREFFRDQGVFDARVLVLSQDRVNYELAFSLESLGNPKPEEHAGVAEAISWFLPPHYPLILISEKDMPAFNSL